MGIYDEMEKFDNNEIHIKFKKEENATRVELTANASGIQILEAIKALIRAIAKQSGKETKEIMETIFMDMSMDDIQRDPKKFLDQMKKDMEKYNKGNSDGTQH